MQSQSVSRLSKSRLTYGVQVLLVHPGKVCTPTSYGSTFSSHCKFSLPLSRIKLCEAWRHLAWPWIPACRALEKKACVETEGLKCNCRHVLRPRHSRQRWEKVHDAWLSNICFKNCFYLRQISPVSSVHCIQALFDFIGPGSAYKVRASRAWSICAALSYTDLFTIIGLS